MKAITFDENMVDYIFKAFSFNTGKDGHVRDGRGFKLKALDGEFITKDEFAGILKTDDGIRAVRKGFIGALDLFLHQEKNP